MYYSSKPLVEIEAAHGDLGDRRGQPRHPKLQAVRVRIVPEPNWNHRRLHTPVLPPKRGGRRISDRAHKQVQAFLDTWLRG